MKGFLCGLLSACLLSLAAAAPIDDYVWRADPAYGWTEISSWSGKWLGKGYTGYKLNMTSQNWLTDADFSPSSQSKSLWWHILLVLVPDEIKYTTNATMYITGGSMDTFDVEKSEDTEVALSLATGTGVVTGVLYQVPNEHTTFAADPIQKSRTEDSIIAFTWDHFLRDTSKPEVRACVRRLSPCAVLPPRPLLTHPPPPPPPPPPYPPQWLVRFPMVKASVRAMDAIAEFVTKKMPEKNLHLDYFTVAGASKRGWTTWLVGVVDPKRVVAMVPIVLDAINFVDVIHHQYRSYNGFSFALSDYTDMNLLQRMDTPEMLLLQQNEDPYFFKERMTMPKLIINAALDEFQQPDDNLFWWKSMPEPKHLMMVPNAEHSLATGILEVVPGVAAWISHLLRKTAGMPKLDWTIDSTDGHITATIDQSRGSPEIEEVNAWWAYSCGANADAQGGLRKDFRCINMDNPCKCGLTYDGNCLNLKSFWTKQPLQPTQTVALPEGGNTLTYSAHFDAPADGRYVGYFIEATYKKLTKGWGPEEGEQRALAAATPAEREALKIGLHGSTKDKIDEIKRKFEEAKDKIEAAKEKVETAKEIYEALKGVHFPEIPLDLKERLVFTTQVSIFPQSYPYADCVGNGIDTSDCKNVLR